MDSSNFDFGNNLTSGSTTSSGPMYQIGGMVSGATMQIRQLQGGATKLISGIPQFEQIDFKVSAKAVYMSSDILILHVNKFLQDKNVIGYGNFNYQHLQLYKAGVQDVQSLHLKDRPHLFLSECTTAVTPDGQIFVMGGKYKCTYTRCNIELVLDIHVNQHP